MPRFLSSHPDTKHRKNHLNEIAQTHGWIEQGNTRPIPGYVLKKMAADKQQAKEEQKPNSDLN